jgi:hypothetical protein
LFFHFFSWIVIFIGSLTFAISLVAAEMRRPDYHGIGWKIINPKLPEWWQSYLETQKKTEQGAAANP